MHVNIYVPPFLQGTRGGEHDSTHILHFKQLWGRVGLEGVAGPGSPRKCTNRMGQGLFNTLAWGCKPPAARVSLASVVVWSGSVPGNRMHIFYVIQRMSS